MVCLKNYVLSNTSCFVQITRKYFCASCAKDAWNFANKILVLKLRRFCTKKYGHIVGTLFLFWLHFYSIERNLYSMFIWNNLAGINRLNFLKRKWICSSLLQLCIKVMITIVSIWKHKKCKNFTVVLYIVLFTLFTPSKHNLIETLV